MFSLYITTGSEYMTLCLFQFFVVHVDELLTVLQFYFLKFDGFFFFNFTQGLRREYTSNANNFHSHVYVCQTSFDLIWYLHCRRLKCADLIQYLWH